MLPSRARSAVQSSLSPSWTRDDVKTWLTAVGFPEVAAAAWQRNVDGKMLQFLGKEGWQELGVSSAVERARIMSLTSEQSETAAANSRSSSAPSKPQKFRRGAIGALQRFFQLVRKLDGAIWADHKKVWFEHLEHSGKSPEEFKDFFCMQLDSYNLMTLLLLSGVLPTATGICSDIGWDADGWPVDKVKFACLIFSIVYSLLLIFHVSLVHLLHLMVSGVSGANLPIFLKAFGNQLLSEAGVGYVVVLYAFGPWLLLCGAVFMVHANAVMWCTTFACILLSYVAYGHLSSLVKDDFGNRPRLFEGFQGRAKVLVRLLIHSGLFGPELPLDPADYTQDELLERLAQISLEQPYVQSLKPDYDVLNEEETESETSM